MRIRGDRTISFVSFHLGKTLLYGGHVPPSPLHDKPLGRTRVDPCRRHSRAYLRHLIAVGEQTASTLLTIHNLTFLLGLMRRARASIIDGTFEALRAEIDERWRDAPGPGTAARASLGT